MGPVRCAVPLQTAGHECVTASWPLYLTAFAQNRLGMERNMIILAEIGVDLSRMYYLTSRTFSTLIVFSTAVLLS